jgi:carboxypeptidase C (cathepsin A)
MTKMTLAELMQTIDVTNIDPEQYTSTTIDDYELVTEDNFYAFALEANTQFKFLSDYENLHGFYVVDWRVNFARLFEFICHSIPPENWDEHLKTFMRFYDDESAPELYRRLGLDEEER